MSTDMGLSILSPEAQILLLTAGGARNDSRIRDLLAGPLDWEKLGWLAARERAAPVLWERLQGVGAAGPLPSEAAHLHRLAMVSEFRMLHLEQRLAESLEALERSGIDVMLLKGAALAVTSYGSFVKRPMVDLDLLMRAGEAERARDVLVQAGWVASSSERFEEFFRGHHHLPALNDARGTGVQLELHTGLFFEGHPFELPLAGVWHRARPITLKGRRAYVPGAHDQLLHLCLHFAWSHMLLTGAWRAFRDLDTLLSTGEIRWDEFVKMAVASRGASCCFWTLYLARELVGIEIPSAVLDAMRPPLPDALFGRVERHFTYHLLPTEALCPSVAMAYTMWRLGVRPRWSGHGGVRPWGRADDFLFSDHERESGSRRLAEQLRNLRGWRRYVRDVLITNHAH